MLKLKSWYDHIGQRPAGLNPVDENTLAGPGITQLLHKGMHGTFGDTEYGTYLGCLP